MNYSIFPTNRLWNKLRIQVVVLGFMITIIANFNFAANPILIEEKKMEPNKYYDYYSFSPDCTIIAGNGENSVDLYTIDAFDFIATINGHFPRFLPSGTEIMTIGMDRIPRLWNIKTGEVLYEYDIVASHLPSRKENQNFDVSPDGNYFATSNYSVARIWKIITGESLYELFDYYTHHIVRIKFVMDGNKFLTCAQIDSGLGGYSGTFKLWDMHNGELMISGKRSTGVYSADISPDGNYIVYSYFTLSDRSYYIVIYYLFSSDLIYPLFTINTDGACNHITFTPDGYHFLGQIDDTLQLWEISNDHSRFYKICDIQNKINTWDKAKCFQITSDGQQLLLSQDYNNIQRWILFPTDTPTMTPTNTPTPTPTNTPTPTQTYTPTPTPTPTTNPILHIYDDVQDHAANLCGQTDIDTPENRNLTLAWQSPTENVRDWHIYVREWLGGMRFLGRTGTGDTNRFDWYPRAPHLTAEFVDGPRYNSLYHFQVLRIDDSLDVGDYYKTTAPVGFQMEGENPAALPKVSLPNLNPGQFCIYDDLLGGNDLTNGVDEDTPDARAIQLAWNFGLEFLAERDYHLFVRVDEGNWQFLGQTGCGEITYFWWTPYNKFTTAPAFADGPQGGHSYQFMVFLILPHGLSRVFLTSGVLQYAVIIQ